jgi:hypothetical protein
VENIARYNGCDAGAGDLRNAADGDLEFAFDHVVDFFLTMGMFVDRRTTLEVVMCKGHVRRVEVASMPARQPLDNIEAVDLNKSHNGSPGAS